MDIGLLTAAFSREQTFEQIAAWAAEAGFTALEVASGQEGHIRPGEVKADGGPAIRRVLERTGLRISALAAYMGPRKIEEVALHQAALAEVIDAARILGVPVVCTLAGFPIPDGARARTKLETIRDVLPGYLGPLAERAAAAGVRIALENWYATNLQHLDHFRALLEAVPAPNVGFNFDPSHLLWQGIDYLAAVDEFKDRLFHTHAKDTAIYDDRLRRIGCLERGWWQYVIPGYGRVRWPEYIHRLRLVGYDGVLSIEHEDRAFSPEEGFLKGLRYLRQLI